MFWQPSNYALKTLLYSQNEKFMGEFWLAHVHTAHDCGFFEEDLTLVLEIREASTLVLQVQPYFENWWQFFMSRTRIAWRFEVSSKVVHLRIKKANQHWNDFWMDLNLVEHPSETFFFFILKMESGIYFFFILLVVVWNVKSFPTTLWSFTRVTVTLLQLWFSCLLMARRKKRMYPSSWFPA